MKMKKAKVNIRLMTQDEFDKKVKRSPEMIQEYLRLAINNFKENRDQELFLYAIMRAVKWFGVMNVARKAGLTRQGVYTALNRQNANPNLNTFRAILSALGITMTFEVGDMPELPSRTYKRTASHGSYASL